MNEVKLVVVVPQVSLGHGVKEGWRGGGGGGGQGGKEGWGRGGGGEGEGWQRACTPATQGNAVDHTTHSDTQIGVPHRGEQTDG